MRNLLIAFALTFSTANSAIAAANNNPPPPGTFSKEDCAAISDAHKFVSISLIYLSGCYTRSCALQRAHYQFLKLALEERFRVGNCRYWTTADLTTADLE